MRWVSLFLPFFLFSAPIGNPFMPGMLREELFSLIKIPIHVRLGYEGNFVFDRYLDQYQTGSGSLEKYEIYAIRDASLVISSIGSAFLAPQAAGESMRIFPFLRAHSGTERSWAAMKSVFGVLEATYCYLIGVFLPWE